ILLSAAGAMLAIAAATANPPWHAYAPLPSGLRDMLLRIALWTAVAAGLLAVGYAALLGISFAVNREARAIPLPQRPGRLPRPTLRAPQPIRGPRAPVSQIARTMSRVVEHFIHAAIVVLLAFGDALLLLLHWLSVLVVGWINWLLGWSVSLALVLFD